MRQRFLPLQSFRASSWSWQEPAQIGPLRAQWSPCGDSGRCGLLTGDGEDLSLLIGREQGPHQDDLGKLHIDDALDLLTDGMQVRVTGHELREGVGDGGDRFGEILRPHIPVARHRARAPAMRWPWVVVALR